MEYVRLLEVSSESPTAVFLKHCSCLDKKRLDYMKNTACMWWFMKLGPYSVISMTNDIALDEEYRQGMDKYYSSYAYRTSDSFVIDAISSDYGDLIDKLQREIQAEELIDTFYDASNGREVKNSA